MIGTSNKLVTYFKNTQLKKLKEKYCAIFLIEKRCTRFQFNGDPVLDNHTANSLHIEDDDIIDVLEAQIGGDQD